MAKMAVLLPYPELSPLVEEMFLGQSKIDRHSVQFVPREQVEAYAGELEQQGCDIIMARGLYARLARKVSRLPVVEIRITAQELGELVLDIQEELGVKECRVALIGEALMMCDTSSFQRFFRTEVLHYTYSPEPDAIASIRGSIRRAMADGCQAIIGGKLVCQELEALGICHRFMQTGRESLLNAFDIARHLAYAIDQEKTRRAEIETMFDFTSSAIVRVARDGTVLWASPLVGEILGIDHGEILGKDITGLFPVLKSEALYRELMQGKSAYISLLPPNRKETAVNISPIQIDGQITGAILTFQEGRRILEMSNELRQELYNRGYLARWTFDALPVGCESSRETLRLAKRISQYSAPVLLRGPVGSGKDMLSQCIHNAGITRGNAYIPVDCRAYHTETLDTMLFGGYSSRRDAPASMVEIAQNGTLYLAHVEDLSQELQYKIIQLIRGQFLRNGANRAVEANVRIIASTGINLISRVEEGTFRNDLYFALHALEIDLRPLRERSGDVDVWVEYYLAQWRKRYDRNIHLTQGARDYLNAYDWPGNLDQINSVCEQVVLLSEHHSVNEAFLRQRIERMTPRVQPETGTVVVYRDQQGERIVQLLKEYNGNRQKVAEALGVSKTTLWRYMNKYGIGKDFSY